MSVMDTSRGLEEFPNPFRIANIFHFLVAILSGLSGMWLGVEATKENTELQAWVVTLQFIAAVFLLLVAALHTAWALKHSSVSINPENVGGLGGVKANDGRGYDAVKKILMEVPLVEPPKEALANKLFALVPGLRNAPLFIRFYAVKQWQRGWLALATFVSFIGAMLLTWGQPGQSAIATAYFTFCCAFVIRPDKAFMKLVTGNLEAPSSESAMPDVNVSVVVLLILAPLMARVVTRSFGYSLESSGVFPSQALWLTLFLLLSAVTTAFLCYLALKKQTDSLQGSRATFKETAVTMKVADVNEPFVALDRHLRNVYGENSEYKMPTRKLIRYNSNIKAAEGDFIGVRVEESVPRASIEGVTGNNESFQKLFSEVWANARYRPLIILGVIGTLLIIAVIAATFLFLGRASDGLAGNPMLYVLFVLGLFAAAEHSFSAAHQLWQRYEFMSDVVIVEFSGLFKKTAHIVKDRMLSPGTSQAGGELSTTLPTIQQGDIKVAAFTVKSVCFSVNGARTAISIWSDPTCAEKIAEIMMDDIERYGKDRQKIVRGEADIKAAYSGNQLPDQQLSAQSALDYQGNILLESKPPENDDDGVK